MAFKLEIHANGVKQTVRNLHKTADRLLDPSPGLAIVAERFNEIAKGEFDSQGGNFGGWDPLRPATLEDRARKGYGPTPILERSGDFMRGLTDDTDPEHVVRITPEELHWGSTTPFGNYHMTGTANMSARPPFRMDELDKKTVVVILRRYAMTGLTDV